MNVEAKAESVYFSVKGQVVIPRRLRKEFEIEEGTRAYVEGTPEGIPHQTRYHEIHPQPARVAQRQGRDEGHDGGSQGGTGTVIMSATMKTGIRKGDQIRIKPEWQDPGDDKFIWVALEDEDGGRVRIAPTNTGLTIPPNQVVDTNMVELAS